jgi:hypothetical protein
MLEWGMEDLIPVTEEDLADILAWGMNYNPGTVRSLTANGVSLEVCRRIARLQLEHLRRSGILAYRRPVKNHGHFRPEPR